MRGQVAVARPETYDSRPQRTAPIVARGKFFLRGDDKFFLKCVCYGPFAPGENGAEFPARQVVRRDFALLREMGANALRTFTVPPQWLLDLAAAHDLVVLVGLPWTQHVCFLDQPHVMADIRTAIATGVRSCEHHPAVFAYLIGNEIPGDVVRWHGPDRVREFVEELYCLAKEVDGDSLVSYANFPPTEYLDLDFLDFTSFNVYLHRERDFRRYLSRLQNLAGDKPLVLTEFGLDSLREGQDGQASGLAWQIRAAFELGCAGTTVFAWTDDWFTGGFQVEDWAFGLVDARRNPKPAFHAVQRLFQMPLPPPVPNPPKISVVICAYNAERTMDACLASVRGLRYPNYEVIVVNDGSTDRTLEIAERYSEARVISQPNRGLSAARNVGLEAATGEIVAYTDSDCVVDPDWLTYLAHRFVHDGYVAVGGPNLPPPEKSRTEACVAASPGGPTHVLLDDEVAEHIPGCNMAFRKSALTRVEGFDPIFRAAGDDVDLCWRLQNEGHVIGFSPAALVWHHRRNTVRAYLKQQMGYGAAETLLYVKHPYRFNRLGQSKWLGRIYGDLAQSIFSRRPVVYYGTFGRAMFQTLYEAPASVITVLPFTLEWNLIAFVLLMGAAIANRYLLLGAVPLLVALASAAATAWRVKVDPRYDDWRSRLLVAGLTYLGPLARSLQRYRWRLRETGRIERIQFAAPSQRPCVKWLARRFTLAYWSGDGKEKEHLLQGVMEFLVPRKYTIAVGQGWNEWDIEVSGRAWTRAMVMVSVENHGGPKRLLRVRCGMRSSLLARVTLGSCAGLVVLGALAGFPEFAAAASLVGVLALGFAVAETLRLGRVLYHALEIVADRLGLKGLGASAQPSPR